MEKDKVMRDRDFKKYLSSEDYSKFIRYKSEHLYIDEMDDDLLDKLCGAIVEWAKTKDVNVYTQIFLPLTGYLSGKFLALYRTGETNEVRRITSKDLKYQECDASSFPNGGARGCANARGYTKWDIHSPIYIMYDCDRPGVLVIPSIFTSYDGTALDNIDVLLRCKEGINRAVERLYEAMGRSYSGCNIFAGMEQEYFLFPKDIVGCRADLALCGKELLYDSPTIPQSQYAHYFALPRPKIAAYMNALRGELASIGIDVEAQHSEVAPRQYEIVTRYSDMEHAVLENAIVKQKISEVADRYGYIAEFNEKIHPRINGSGKHLNISLSVNGQNVFKVGSDPSIFLLFFTTMIDSVRQYQDLVLASISSYSNDNRLGGYEAPPKDITVYIGEKLYEVLLDIRDKKYSMCDILGIDPALHDRLAQILGQDFDRNRTSPFAFTGDKFEFRLMGSANTGFMPLVVISTILVDKINSATSKLQSGSSILDIVMENIISMDSVIYNGDNMTRSSKGNKCALDAIKIYNSDTVRELFVKNNIFSETELKVIYNTETAKYIDEVTLDAHVLIHMLEDTLKVSQDELVASEICKCIDSISDELSCKKINYKRLARTIHKVCETYYDMRDVVNSVVSKDDYLYFDMCK